MQNEERINGLENQVRTLKRIVYGFGCLLVAGVVVSATSMKTVPDVRQAKKFEVLNDEGKVVAFLSAEEDGGMLGIGNNEGKPVAGLGGGKDGGVLGIINKNGIPVAGIIAGKYGGELSVGYKDGHQVAAITAHVNGGALTISKKDGNTVTVLGADKFAGGVLMTFDNKGELTSQTP